ncbi:hypothetical protein N7495_006101, partial [Penicillium taxi]|uniref:uncharacterized protein n=1 Tax=Penicillium taxi TaxID=168475 RepID=UPI00254584A0
DDLPQPAYTPIGPMQDHLARGPSRPDPRHISPSPLHTSSLPQSFLHGDFSPSSSPLSLRSSTNSSPQNQSRFTVSRVANAPFPVLPSNTTMSQSPDTSGTESEITSRTGNNIPNPPGAAEPDPSASSPVSSLPGDRPSHRIMPRTSSIDSAISSLSSASHKSSFDVKALSQADISHLINAAGSAEAVIVHLLKEKHHAASQNSQLWKLVDKQRTLILGLNKDLERAFKEKEKYKKKVKELQDLTPPLSTVTALANSGIQAKPEPETERKDERPPIDQPSIVPPSTSARILIEDGAGLSPSSDIPSPTESDGKLPHPSRKPPPAPLNLRLDDNTCEEPTYLDSESDYGDADIPSTDRDDRGRRKTREEDDRDREAAQTKDVENKGSVGTARIGSFTSVDPEMAPRNLATRSPPNVGGSGTIGSVLNSNPKLTTLNVRPYASMPKSPGLPMSPRPEDRPLGSPLPRMPRDLNAMAASSTGQAYNTPGLPLSPRAGNYPAQFPRGNHLPTMDPTVKIDKSPRSPWFPELSISKRLVSDEYPGLLLPPNALPVIQVRVSSSRLRPSRNSYMVSKPLDEEPVFTLSVISRSEMSELWRVEKVIASLPYLDQQVRQLASLSVRLPDRSIFSGHSPAKIDARRAALNTYFDSLLNTRMDEKAALIICQFLTNDAIEPRDDETSLLKGPSHSKLDVSRGPDGRPRKEGYLTKRGKNFGGWKARYFVLQGPDLKYFESPGGPHMGTIKLHHAQIGKQSHSPSGQGSSPPATEEDADHQYRHAFLILEPKKKDSLALVRHVLCAESDEERDTWVDALMEYVESPSSDNESQGKPQVKSKQQSSSSGSKAKAVPSSGGKRLPKGVESLEHEIGGSVQGFSFDDTIAAEPPILGSSLDQAPRSPRILALSTDLKDTNQSWIDPASQSPKIISAPTNGTVIQDLQAWGNKTTTSTKEKKRSIWGFRTRSSFDLTAHDSGINPIHAERKEPVRAVFGIPLAEAVKHCAPLGVDIELPAVVYRCIEYLHAKGAADEEGIFRLSGSNVVIKGLKERFNNEGDVDFLAGDQYYDVHAVASLFKQYLRELPTTVLTRELHLDFLRVLELDDREKKVAAFNSLVHCLPQPNLSLLRALSLFLIEIVNNSDVNKMTVRNVGIVFAPTLNIPAPVFSMFLTDFDSIFGDTGSASSPTIELTVDHSLSADDIRSPRHQMFSDIPTPSYNQSSFPSNGVPPTDHHDNPRGTNDTGFIPMQPTYDAPTHRHDVYNQHNQHKGASSSFGSLNGMLSPSQEDTRSAKAKRRESSMLLLESMVHPNIKAFFGRC